MRFLRYALIVFTLAALALSVIAADTTSSTTTATKKKTASKKRRSSSSAKQTSGRTTATSRASSRVRQTQPTPERYKEIQQALASKGYLTSEPSGAWNQESADAMRRFQQDQNINPSGKIDSLSLIALGLGPKRPTNSPAGASEPKPAAPTTN
jgi:hypothetical protein